MRGRERGVGLVGLLAGMIEVGVGRTTGREMGCVMVEGENNTGNYKLGWEFGRREQEGRNRTGG